MADHCPDCGQRIWRLDGDRLLRCHRCGWTEGWIGLRYITHWPYRLATDFGVLKLMLVFIFLGVVALGTTTGFAVPFDRLPEAPANFSSAQSEDLNTSNVERLVFEKLNDRRAERQPRLDYNSRAATAARIHAEDMAKNEYFNHTSLDGETQIERYSFCEGGENAHKTHWKERVRMSDGSTEVHTSEQELATGIVRGWMNSRPHRERGIYGEAWSSGGAGIAVSEDDEVYAVFGFCR